MSVILTVSVDLQYQYIYSYSQDRSNPAAVPREAGVPVASDCRRKYVQTLTCRQKPLVADKPDHLCHFVLNLPASLKITLQSVHCLVSTLIFYLAFTLTYFLAINHSELHIKHKNTSKVTSLGKLFFSLTI